MLRTQGRIVAIGKSLLSEMIVETALHVSQIFTSISVSTLERSLINAILVISVFD